MSGGSAGSLVIVTTGYEPLKLGGPHWIVLQSHWAGAIGDDGIEDMGGAKDHPKPETPHPKPQNPNPKPSCLLIGQSWLVIEDLGGD